MKNFVKLIQQAHAERFSSVVNRIIAQQIPVAFLSIAPINQAVVTANNFRNQGFNIQILLVADEMPLPADIEFTVVNVTDADKLYPQPEYVFVMDEASANFAVNLMRNSKIIMPHPIRRLPSDAVYEIFMAHLDDLREVYASLIDEESKKVFRGYWLGCITNRIDKVVYADTPHYFLTGFIPKAGDIFIDGGSYNGFTAAQFASLGCKVYSFEMNKINYEMGRKLAAEKNFVLENLGLGSYEHKAQYINADSSSRVDFGGTETAIITTLDSYVREKNLPRVDFIKLDVEGAELDVLRGATMSIAAFKPRLMLSAYHKLDDLWTLMNFVKSIRPDYEFALRQYPAGCNEREQSLFDAFGMNVRKLYFEECVLFAR